MNDNLKCDYCDKPLVGQINNGCINRDIYYFCNDECAERFETSVQQKLLLSNTNAMIWVEEIEEGREMQMNSVTQKAQCPICKDYNIHYIDGCLTCKNRQKTAIVTGCNGMDGSILSDKLLSKGYKVIGVDRWNPTGNSINLSNAIKNENFIFESGDITERDFMYRLITKYHPDYFYNMAAISLVPESFKIPQTIFETNTMAVINILEIIRTYSHNTRFYQASTSEQIGENTAFPQNTDSIMLPNSPYSIAKLASYHLVRMYRNAFGIFAVNGMLWNHEGSRRGPTFVTRKITLHIAKQTKEGANHIEPLQIGNLDSYRDWGLADEYCDAMIMMMEADKPNDYAVNTGESHTIREFIEEAYNTLGVNITWDGSGKNEKGYDDAGTTLVEVNEKYYRPVEVPYLCGDHSKIKNILGWEPKTKFKELVKIMVESDLNGK